MSLCPICCGSFVRYEVENVELDLCTTCGAVWFDHGELTELIGTQFQHRDGGRRAVCPRCEKTALTRARRPDRPSKDTAASALGVHSCAECRGCLLTRESYQGLVSQLPAQSVIARDRPPRFWLVDILSELGIGLLGS